MCATAKAVMANPDSLSFHAGDAESNTASVTPNYIFVPFTQVTIYGPLAGRVAMNCNAIV